ncbi:MAG: glycosyltransferase family 39 protein [Chloroflexi bacterium]|nr:glycosyltransferase family 39 protein [Chloroflexota bacterium]
MKTTLLSRTPRWLPLLILLLALGAALRLVNLNAPPLDFHSTRQLRNFLVARSIYYNLLPNANPQQHALAQSFYRAVGQYEPPITETIVATTYLFTGGESFAIPRIYGTIFWLLAGIALFDLCRRMASPIAGLVSLAYFLVLPFAVQASRSFQPDPLMTSSFVIGIYFLYRWMASLTPSPLQKLEERTDVRNSWKWAILAALFLGFATLVKVVIAFFVGAAAIAAVFATFGMRFWKSKQVWAMAALMIAPAFGYYVLGHPGRSTEYFFLWTIDLLKLITSIHFYAEWLGFIGGLFGLTILFLSLVGTLLAPPRFRWVMISLWIGYLLYGLTLPFQMYTHTYYHIQLTPVVALGLAPVAEAVAAKASGLTRFWKAALIGVVIVIIGYQSWAARSNLIANDYSGQPVFWKKLGDVIPANANVIGLTQDYGYDLMYWGWRKVNLWPYSTDLASVKKPDRNLAAEFSSITAGNDYFLVTTPSQLEKQPDLKIILNGYAIASQGDGYTLYDLHRPK